MATSKPGPFVKPPNTKCPICGAPGDAHYRPFCSRRCADVDLSRWLRGAYVIPGGNADADEDGDDTAAARQPANAAKGANDEDA